MCFYCLSNGVRGTLIYLSYIKKQMQVLDLFKKHTIQGVLDKLDVIECFETPGQQLRVGELLEKQKEIDLSRTGS